MPAEGPTRSGDPPRILKRAEAIEHATCFDRAGRDRVGADIVLREVDGDRPRELHDGVSQLLASMHFRLAALHDALPARGVGPLRRELTRTLELVARGPSSHGSIPTEGNAVGHLARAVAAISAWKPAIRLNETTRAYFTRLASVSPKDDAARFTALLSGDTVRMEEAARYFEQHAPAHAALLRPTVSPTMLRAGNRYNVIPSEATATLDVRLLPDDDPAQLIGAVTRVINDPMVEVRFAERDGLPRPLGVSGINTDGFRAIESAIAQNYDTVTIPSMGAGATDNAQLRGKGVQCYGVGPATDAEDAPKGFGAHSDQERILERELQRFMHFTWDVADRKSTRLNSSHT